MISWGHFYVMFHFQSFDQITTLTYVLMDNFCFLFNIKFYNTFILTSFSWQIVSAFIIFLISGLDIRIYILIIELNFTKRYNIRMVRSHNLLLIEDWTIVVSYECYRILNYQVPLCSLNMSYLATFDFFLINISLKYNLFLIILTKPNINIYNFCNFLLNFLVILIDLKLLELIHCSFYNRFDGKCIIFLLTLVALVQRVVQQLALLQ